MTVLWHTSFFLRRKHVDKTYYAKVSGKVTEEDVVNAGRRRGYRGKGSHTPGKAGDPFHLGVRYRICRKPVRDWESEIRLTIHEGKFHQVKRMMEALGKKVTYLKRLSMGPLALPADLPTGKYRSLTEKELELLKSAGNR